jgi:hypothetical protein
MEIIKVFDALRTGDDYYFKKANDMCDFMMWDYAQFCNFKSRKVKSMNGGKLRFIFKECIVEYVLVR